MPAPTYVDSGASGVNGSNGTSVVINFTGSASSDVVGEQSNDFAVVPIYKESTAAYTATPTGWTRFASVPIDQDTAGYKYTCDLWGKKLDGTEGSETWSWSGSTWRYGECAVYRGLLSTEWPVVQVVVEKETDQNNNPVHPGCTIQRTDSMLLWIVFNFADIDNSAAPSGFTFRDPDAITGLATNIRIYDDLSTSPGASGTITGNLSGDIEYPVSILVELATVAGEAAALAPIFERHPAPKIASNAPRRF